MTDTTPKQRYEARKELRRQSREPDYRDDDDINHDFIMDLAERFVVAVERISRRAQ